MQLDDLARESSSGGIDENKVKENDEKITSRIEELRKDPRVKHVQKNFLYEVASPESLTPQTITGRILINDTDFSKTWGMDNFGQVVNGLTGTLDADVDYPEAMYFASGKLNNPPVIVAVLDTGIAYDHPDLVGKMWNGASCLSDTGAYLGGCNHGYDF